MTANIGSAGCKGRNGRKLARWNAVCGAALVALVGYGLVAEIDTAAHAEGQVVPYGRDREVQHLEGGVIQEILIREGDVVAVGQVMVRLAPAQAQASLDERTHKAAALRAKVAVLGAAVDGKALPAAPATSESGIWRREAESARAWLDSVSAQRGAAGSAYRAVQLQRSAGVYANQSKIIEAEQAASSAQAAVNRMISDARATLASAQAELETLEGGAKGAADRVARLDVIAPVAGVIKTLKVNAVGGVVQPGGSVAEITPTGEGMVIEAKVRPEDIRGLRPGQRALVRLSAYDVSRYGQLEGELIELSPGSVDDHRQGPEGRPYYRAKVRTSATEIGGETLRPGMIADVALLTGTRRVGGYLLEPIIRAKSSALRER